MQAPRRATGQLPELKDHIGEHKNKTIGNPVKLAVTAPGKQAAVAETMGSGQTKTQLVGRTQCYLRAVLH